VVEVGSKWRLDFKVTLNLSSGTVSSLFNLTCRTWSRVGLLVDQISTDCHTRVNLGLKALCGSTAARSRVSRRCNLNERHLIWLSRLDASCLSLC
jgi:hypothetical protein